MAGSRGFAVLRLTAFVDQLGFGIVIPFLPLYAEKLGASGFEGGMLFATYALMQLLVSPRWGRLSDRVGRRPVIIVSGVGACAGFVIHGFASSLEMLFVGRAVLGCFGVGMTTAQAWTADVTTREERGRAMALLGASAAAGFVLGPAVGALGLATGNVRVPFFLAAAVCLANTVLAASVLPSLAPPPRAATIAGAPTGWRTIASCLVVAFVLSYAFSGIEATFALFTNARLGFDGTDTGLLFVLIGVVAVATQALGMRWLTRRLDEPRRLTLGLVLLGGAAVGLPQASSLTGLLPPLVVMAVGYSIATPSLAAWISCRAPVDRQGELMGLAQSATSLARIAGPAAGGLAFDHLGHGAPFQIASIGIVSAAAITLWTR